MCFPFLWKSATPKAATIKKKYYIIYIYILKKYKYKFS